MNYKAIIVAGALFAGFFVSTVPTASATCDVHGYGGPGLVGAVLFQQFGGAGGYNAAADPTCDSTNSTNPDDPIVGVGGDAFPQTGNVCYTAGTGHHPVGDNTTVTVNQGGFPAIYISAATDGSVVTPTGVGTGAVVLDTNGNPCVGNGVDSDTYETDPLDCAFGATGWDDATATPANQPAYITHNWYDTSSATPDPWSGGITGAPAQCMAPSGVNDVFNFAGPVVDWPGALIHLNGAPDANCVSNTSGDGAPDVVGSSGLNLLDNIAGNPDGDHCPYIAPVTAGASVPTVGTYSN